MYKRQGLLGSSLQAKVIIEANEEACNKLEGINLPEIFICSDVEKIVSKNLLESKINVQVELASGGKCLRCWKIVNEVKDDIEVCYRCTSVLKNS